MNKTVLIFAIAAVSSVVSCGNVDKSLNTSELIDGKSPVSVLYVGGNSYDYSPDPTQNNTRKEAFSEFLEEFFSDYEVIDGASYSPELSDNYDVTVFDSMLPILKPEIRETDAEGKVVKYVRPQMLPDDFDRAAVTIGSIADYVGRAIGSKNDWYCLCLDAKALRMKLDHPIFKGPFKTDITVEMCPTPEPARDFEPFSEVPVPDSTLMWRVQTIGYKDSDRFPVGLVSRPGGYEDSPDAEIISGGVSQKSIDAVAIGRHGNMMSWGFAASPAYLTQEARCVLANAIVYMSRFNGKGMLARKYDDRIYTRNAVNELKWMSSTEEYEKVRAAYQKFDDQNHVLYLEAVERKSRGEKPGPYDSYYLKYTPAHIPSYDEYLKMYVGCLYDVLGDVYDKYEEYLESNKSYFYGGDGNASFYVDEDCKAWGIASNDIRLLKKAVSCLERGEDVERAERILSRYTLASFDTAKEWKAWLHKYQKKMFFTESGGWKWLIDGPSSLPGNSYIKQTNQTQDEAVEEDKEPSIYEPVIVTASLVDNGIELYFKLYKGFHIYTNVADSDPYESLSIECSAPDGVECGIPVIPEGNQYGDAGTMVVENDFKVFIPVSGDSAGEILCSVGWQSCDSNSCTQPQAKEFKLRKL